QGMRPSDPEVSVKIGDLVSKDSYQRLTPKERAKLVHDIRSGTELEALRTPRQAAETKSNDKTSTTSERASSVVTEHPYSPERNVKAGHAEDVSPGEKYRVAGFDIGSADLNKPGIKEGLQPVIDSLKADKGDKSPQVFITGLESNSRVPGN